MKKIGYIGLGKMGGTISNIILASGYEVFGYDPNKTACNKFKKQGIEVIGISKDDVDSHKKFCDKMKIPYILLSDIDKEVSKKFGVWAKKKFMGREFMGVIRSTFLVDERGKIFKVYPKVKAAGHSKEVLEAFTN